MESQHPDITPLCTLSDAERTRALARYGLLQPCVEHAVPLTHVAHQQACRCGPCSGGWHSIAGLA